MRILVKTTIPSNGDDWDISRFGLLVEHLRTLGDVEVEAADRDMDGDDSDLARLDSFDQLWLLAVDPGEGLTDGDAAAIRAFHQRGGGLLLTRDHQDLGTSLLKLGAIGRTQCFQRENPEDEEDRRCIDDVETATITWPNYHSGANGDWQTVEVSDHPVACWLTKLPAHPHEGAVKVPPEFAGVGQVVITGRSKRTGRRFPLAAAIAPREAGRIVADSSFHHFADYNWDPRRGCPSFVDEPPGSTMLSDPDALPQARRYVTNIVRWLGGRE